ncbi:hypothetical protein R5M72_12340 [Acinetobacter baumannii]|nr:hypothetical protein [Acinetobacter baumannii]
MRNIQKTFNIINLRKFSRVKQMQTDTFNRDDFMAFFRDEEKLNTLSNEDRIEIFSSILAGSSDLTVSLLDEVLRDYDVQNIIVVDVESIDAQPIPSSAMSALEKVLKFCRVGFNEEQRLYEENVSIEHSIRTDVFEEVRDFVEGLM